MTEPVINGLFLLSATIVGSFITILSTRTQAKISELKDENSKVKNRLKKALQQIEAYHQLEDTYAQELSLSESKAVKTIKTEFRDKTVEQHQCERPDMTAKEAQKQINHIT